MPTKMQLNESTRRKLRLNAKELFEALGIEITEEQKEVVATTQEQRTKQKAAIKRWAIAHREYLNKKMRVYRAANREKVNARARELYDPKKAKIRYQRYYPIRKARRQADPENEVNAYERARYAKNPEKKLAACRAYREAHREEINARARAAYAARKAAEKAQENV